MKVGIIGYGGMGKFHAKNLENVKELTLKGIYDIDPVRLAEAKKNGTTAYKSRRELLQDDEIEIVIIATPNNFHKEISIDALSNGKNVICEKPATINSEELVEVIAAAKKSGKIFSIHNNRRWDKDFNIVKKTLEENLVGKPFYIESRVQGANGIPGDWRCEEISGGGMLLDWGVHLIDQILCLINSPVTEIYAHILKVKFNVDDNFKLLLKFENGLSVLIEVDTYNFIPLPRWHISGEKGTMVINDFDCTGKIVQSKIIEERWEPGIVHTAAGPTKTMAPRPVESIKTLPLPGAQPDCCDYYRNFHKAVLGIEELIVKPEQALKVMKVIDAAFESSKSGKVKVIK